MRESQTNLHALDAATLYSPPISLLALLVGSIAQLGDGGVLSAIDKRPTRIRHKVSYLGLEGDAQADRTHHGGYDKALHHYPYEHYDSWLRELNEAPGQWVTGGFGENISTQGLLESNVCLGDVFTLGTARIQVSQGRQPCAKLNLRFNVPDMQKRVLSNGRAGWYYRVLNEGVVGPDDCITLVSREFPDWPLSRVWSTLFHSHKDPAGLQELANLTVLSSNWRKRANSILEASASHSSIRP